MTKEEITLLEGACLDQYVIQLFPDLGLSKKPSTSIEDMWIIREYIIKSYGNITLYRYCDQYPEACVTNSNGRKLEVFGKTMPEALSKSLLFLTFDHFGDCHPWTVLPTLRDKFNGRLK